MRNNNNLNLFFMKKITLISIFLFITVLSFAQTIVSTTPENKNAVLEEFTGIHCTYCPDGHAIAQSIKDDYPDDFYIINVHTGSFALPDAGEPDFRTDYGAAIAEQSQLAGYPAGTINRHYFGHSQSGSPSGATALGRDTWSSDANTIMGQASYVNVGVEADIDSSSRILTVHVEAYYTGDSPIDTNFINVALLQDNTLGPQIGGGADDNYNHMHRLIEMITGQWGVEISTTTASSFVDKTFTLEIPFDYRGVPVDLDNLKVVAFVTESQQEIITGKGASVTKTVSPLVQNDASLIKAYSIKDNCSGNITPKVKVSNLGSDAITSIDFEYSINGEATQSYSWTGTLASLSSQDIELPNTTFSLGDSNIFSVEISSTDDRISNNTTEDQSFGVAGEVTAYTYVRIRTDDYGYELTWNIKDSSGAIVANGGGSGTEGSSGSYGNRIDVTESYHLPVDCYTLEVLDSYGDGGNAVDIEDSEGDVLITTIRNDYGFGDKENFTTLYTLVTLEAEFNNVRIYPNPSRGIVNFTQAKDLNISIYNVLGKEVYKSVLLSNDESLNLSHLNSGIYLVNISDGNNQETRKLIIK